MATEFEIRIKIGTEVDDARVKASVSALDSAFDKVAADLSKKKITLPHVDVPPIDIPPIDLPEIEAPKITIPPLDIPEIHLPTGKGVSQLALDFHEATSAAKKLEDEQRAALAAMIAAGEEGSDEYVQLVADIIDARKQSEELVEAQRKANKLFDEIDGGAMSHALDDVGKKGQEAGEKVNKAFDFNQKVQAIQNVAGSLSELAQPFVALDTATAQLKTLGDEAASMAPNLREAAIQMSKDLPFAASELQTTMFDALASGVKGGEEGLKGFADTAAKLAVGGGASISAATGLLAGQLNAYGKSSEDATKFADIFFNTVNFGVTSVDELSSQLANVVPTAAAAGVEIENVGASLAVMTSKGVPTAQATTKLNQLLLEIQKPGASLAPILEKAGVSMQSLANDDLPVTLGKIQTALQATGKSAVEAFSSSEASAAFNVLSGDLAGFEQTFKDVRDTTGSAQNAYEQMAGSVQSSTDQMLSRVNAFAIEGLDAMGSGFVSVVQSSAQLAPTIVSLSGLKEIIPEGLFSKAGAGLKGILLPALTQLGIVKRVNEAATIAETGAEIANTAAKGAQAVATEGATVAQYSFNTAMLASPIFLIGAAIGVAVGALLIFGNTTKDLGDALEDANAAKEKFVAADSLAKNVEKTSDEMRKMAGELDALNGKSDPESTKKFNETAAKIAETLPEASTALDTFGSAGENTGRKFEVSTKLVRQMADEQERLAKAARADALANLDDQVGALSDSYREALETQKSLREDKEKLQQAVENGLGDLHSTEAFGNPFDTVKDDLKDTTAELGEQQKKIEEARPKIEALVDTYQDMGLSVEEIAKRTGLTVQQVRDFKGALDGTLVSSQGLERAMSGMGESQKVLVRQTALQAEGYAQAQAKVDELNGKLANAKAVGNNQLADQLQKDLDEAQKIASEKKVALEAKLDEKGVKEALDAIPEAARSKIVPLTTTLDVVLSDKSLEETQQKAGGIINDISELQKSQAEAIGASQKAAYDDKILAKQQEFKKNLEAQAVAVQTNEVRLKELKAQKEAASDPKEVARLNGEIVSLEKKTDAAAKQFVNTATAGKKVGAVKGDVKDVATEFGFAAKGADGTSAAIKRVAQQTAAATGEAADLVQQFANLRKTVDQAVSDNLAKIALVEVKKRLGEQVTAQEQADADAARKAIGNAVARQKLLNTTVENLEIQFGIKQKQRKQATARDLSGLDRELEIEREASQRRLAAIDSEFLREIASVQEEQILKRREFNIREKKLREDLRVATANGNKDAAAKARAELKDLPGLLNSEIATLDQKLGDVIEKAKEKVGTTVLQAIDNAAKQGFALRSAEIAELLSGDDVASDVLREQGREQLRIIVETGKEQLREKVSQNAELNTLIREQANAEIDVVTAAQRSQLEAQQKFNDASDDLRAAGISGDAARAALAPLKAALDQANAELAEASGVMADRFASIREDFIARILAFNDETIKSQPAEIQALYADLRKAQLDATQATEKAGGELRRRLAHQEQIERIRQIDDVTEQEKELKLLAIDEQLAKDLEANKLNEAKKLDLIRAAGVEKRKIEQGYLRDTNVLWDAAYAAQLDIAKGFFTELTAERRRDLLKQADDVDAQLSKLTESLLRQEKSLASFDSEVNDLLEKRHEIMQELGDDGASFWEKLARGADIAFQSIEKVMTERLTTANAKLNEALDEALNSASDAASMTAGDTGDKLESFTARFGASADEVMSKLVDVGNAAAGQIVGIWGQMALTGKATLGDFADAALVTTLKTVRTAIEGNIINIIAAAFAINPLLGAFSIPAVVAIEIMLAKWEADAKGRLGQHGFKKGGHTGHGPADEVAGVAHFEEFVLPEPVIRIPENLALAQHLHAGLDQRAWFEQKGAEWGFATLADLDSLYVDLDGRLQAGFDAMAALEHHAAISEMTRRAEMMNARAEAAKAFQRESLAQAIATDDVMREMRESREANVQGHASTAAAVSEVRAEVAELRRELKARRMEDDLMAHDERAQWAEALGRTERKDSLVGLLKDIRAELARGRR